MPGAAAVGPRMLSFRPRQIDVTLASVTVAMRGRPALPAALPLLVAAAGLKLREDEGAILLSTATRADEARPHRTADARAIRFYDANVDAFLNPDPTRRTETLFFELGGDRSGRDAPVESVPADHLGLHALQALWEERDRDGGLGLSTIERREDRDPETGRYGLVVDYWFGYLGGAMGA